MQHLPTHFDVALALADVLRGAGVHYPIGSVNVSSVANTRKRFYRLVPYRSVSSALSEVLSGLLQRPFSAEEDGWVIDAREARALVRTFSR
jgi:hypothetical protein